MQEDAATEFRGPESSLRWFAATTKQTIIDRLRDKFVQKKNSTTTTFKNEVSGYVPRLRTLKVLEAESPQDSLPKVAGFFF